MLYLFLVSFIFLDFTRNIMWQNFGEAKFAEITYDCNMSREDFEFQCPYCAETIWMEFYPEDGEHQDTIVDCEVCCQPIHYQVQFKNGEAQVTANRDH